MSVTADTEQADTDTDVTGLSDASAEWYSWRNGIRNARCGNVALDTLVSLEQMMLRSEKEKRCSECGESGTVVHASRLIRSVTHYYLCDGCDAHFEGSVGGHTYTVLSRRAGFWQIVSSLSNKRHAERIARQSGESRVRRNLVSA